MYHKIVCVMSEYLRVIKCILLQYPFKITHDQLPKRTSKCGIIIQKEYISKYTTIKNRPKEKCIIKCKTNSTSKSHNTINQNRFHVLPKVIITWHFL